MPIGNLVTKTCVACQQEKPILAKGMCRKCYYVGWRSENREHVLTYEADWRKKNPQKTRAKHKRHYDQNPEKMKAKRAKPSKYKRRNYSLKFHHGALIDAHRATHPDWFKLPSEVAQFGAYVDWMYTMWKRQGCKCANPQCPVTDFFDLCVDHCHRTNEIRWLLCNDCNLALGLLKEDPFRLSGLAGLAAQLGAGTHTLSQAA